MIKEVRNNVTLGDEAILDCREGLTEHTFRLKGWDEMHERGTSRL
jgi:hypothetical protein